MVPQPNPSFGHLAELIEINSIAMLTTAQDGFSPISRPMAARESVAQGSQWFFTDRRSS